jgi:hypothetical protein
MGDRQILVTVLTVVIATLWLTVRAADGLSENDLVTAGSFVMGAVLMWMVLRGKV